MDGIITGYVRSGTNPMALADCIGGVNCPRARERDNLHCRLVALSRIVPATTAILQPGMAIRSDPKTQGRGGRQDLCDCVSRG